MLHSNSLTQWESYVAINGSQFCSKDHRILNGNFPILCFILLPEDTDTYTKNRRSADAFAQGEPVR